MSIHRWTYDKFFIPHSSCVSVKGYLRSVICDLQRNAFVFIPNAMHEMMLHGRGLTVKEILDKRIVSDKESLEEYMNFLEEKEFALWCEVEEKELYKPLNVEWDQPFVITNATIDFGSEISYQFNHLVDLLDGLGCQYIQLWSKSERSTEFWNDVLSATVESRIRYVEIFTKYSRSNDSVIDTKNLFLKHPRLVYYYEYLAPRNEMLQLEHDGSAKLIRTMDNIVETNGISAVRPELFSCNISTFMEAQSNHSYFNRKIHICEDGSIKNASECRSTFGKIEDFASCDELISIIRTPQYRELWSISKDDCDVCKDCEFRYLCVDNRLPIFRKENDWFFANECNYNPYISKWKGEEGYKNLAECGVKSCAEGFVIDNEEIQTIIDALWDN